MKITILQVGKTKEKGYLDLEDEFLKRLGPFTQIDTQVIKTSDPDTENEKLQEKIRALKERRYTVVALDLKGERLTSEQFSKWLRRQRDHEAGQVAFVIGGPKGMNPDTLALIDLSISFSSMTFTHQMVRLFLLEQIYRGFMIMSGRSYHY